MSVEYVTTAVRTTCHIRLYIIVFIYRRGCESRSRRSAAGRRTRPVRSTLSAALSHRRRPRRLCEGARRGFLGAGGNVRSKRPPRGLLSSRSTKLSLSSLQFKVTRTRFVSALPGVALVSAKQRAHHIVFSWRHILACACHFWMLERRLPYRASEKS